MWLSFINIFYLIRTVWPALFWMRSKQFFPVLPPTESSVSEFWRRQHKLNSKVTFLIKSQSWGTLAAVRAAFACSKLQQRKLHGRRALGLRGCPKTEGVQRELLSNVWRRRVKHCATVTQSTRGRIFFKTILRSYRKMLNACNPSILMTGHIFCSTSLKLLFFLVDWMVIHIFLFARTPALLCPKVRKEEICTFVAFLCLTSFNRNDCTLLNVFYDPSCKILNECNQNLAFIKRVIVG